MFGLFPPPHKIQMTKMMVPWSCSRMCRFLRMSRLLLGSLGLRWTGCCYKGLQLLKSWRTVCSAKVGCLWTPKQSPLPRLYPLLERYLALWDFRCLGSWDLPGKFTDQCWPAHWTTVLQGCKLSLWQWFLTPQQSSEILKSWPPTLSDGNGHIWASRRWSWMPWHRLCLNVSSGYQ